VREKERKREMTPLYSRIIFSSHEQEQTPLDGENDLHSKIETWKMTGPER
jgi:hypothetical protein